MKRKLTTLTAVAMASTIAIAAAGMAEAHMGQGQGHAQMGKSEKSQPGSGMMGQKKGQGRMMGQGQMGQGGMMGRMMQHDMKGHAAGFKREKALSTDEVRRVIDGRLAVSGLSRLKAGTAKDVGETATEVDVVTEKGDMVFRLKVDRKTGRAVIIE
ncbi:MAG: hypothetical protein OEM91_08385 [Hyphomicrobiales bacterium]|nr:hypothetical protein [Hyphomicrobiales bacterium]